MKIFAVREEEWNLNRRISMENLMSTRKVIIIDDEIEKHITAICDAALRSLGMQVIFNVNKVAVAIKEEVIPEPIEKVG